MILICCLVLLGFFNADNSIYSIILVLFFSIEFFLFWLKENNKETDMLIFLMFFLAFIIRIILVYYDVNINEIDPGDCRDFRIAAENFFYTNQISFRGEFSGTILFMGIIYKIFGPQRIILQYCGILCFFGASSIVYSILKRYAVSQKTCIVCMAWMLFTPLNIINTSISNREAFIIFLVTCSLYCFILWIENKKKRYFFGMLLSTVLGMILHSGIIGVFVGYVMWMAFYDKKRQKIHLRMRTIVILCFTGITIYYLYQSLGGTWIFAKFGEMEDVLDITTKAAGYQGEEIGSTYVIPGGNSTSILGMLLSTPLRAIYFVLSPMPWYWRGGMDFILFMFCSFPHIIMIFLFCKNLFLDIKCGHVKDDNFSLIIVLMVSCLAISIIFGWGVRNAGTAIRHRDKFISIYTVLLALLLKRGTNETDFEKRKEIS